MGLALKEITNKNHIPLGMQYFAIYNQEKKALVGFARRYFDKKLYDIDIVDLNWNEDLDLSSSKFQIFKEVMDYLMTQVIVKEKNALLWKVTADHFLVDVMAVYQQILEFEQKRNR